MRAERTSQVSRCNKYYGDQDPKWVEHECFQTSAVFDDLFLPQQPVCIQHILTISSAQLKHRKVAVGPALLDVGTSTS